MSTAEHLGPDSSDRIPLGAYTVLLADDSADDLFLMKRALQDFPQLKITWCARDGQEAIAYLEGHGEFGNREKHPRPDIVVLDLNMPTKDGFEVLNLTGKRYGRPVLGVLSSSNRTEDEKRALELGADLVERKNFGDGDLKRFFHWLERMATLRKHESASRAQF